ncbi:MAG: hypothetical protein N4A33_00855 [Bacteriovoracaceae bacterium]|jgi:hypothetical protein|nr:hypothetical protein [Bacteriovoracaceae bacterium]
MILRKILLMLLVLTSCASTKISFIQDSSESEKTQVTYSIKQDYFLWGSFPARQEVNVGQFFQKKGYKKIESFSVQYERETQDVIWTLLSLGVYTPQTLILKAKVD